MTPRICRSGPVPTRIRQLAELVAEHHGNIHRAMEMRPGKIFELLLKLDALRQPDRLGLILNACEADARGRLGLEDSPYPQAARISAAALAAASVRYADVTDIEALEGAAVGEALRKAQCAAVVAALSRAS